MIILAAVDIKEGRAVRLRRGDLKKEKVYFDNPLEAAKIWQSQGVTFLHVVDLEGAAAGKIKNFKNIKDICQGVDIPVEVGGGIRTEKDIRKILNVGAKRVVLGTTAAEDRVTLKSLIRKFKDRIIISVDAVSGYAAVKGWKERKKIKTHTLIEELKGLGINEIIYTDISRDGTLKGVRLKSAEDILDKLKVKLIFGGGISSPEDIIELKKLEVKGLNGIIIGKALYEGKIDLKKALKIALN